MGSANFVTVRVDRSEHGDWKVVLPDGDEHVRCETLHDARRIAYLQVAQRHPCKLIVRDAYHRVVEHGLFDGAYSVSGDDQGSPPARIPS
jgi:hypothetical protein